jgi:putative CocE/NonD family hydrolase
MDENRDYSPIAAARPSFDRLGAFCSMAAAIAMLLSACQIEKKPEPEKQAEAKPASLCHTEMVAMRDGAKLATDIYQPDATGKHPVVITRTPYGAQPFFGAPGSGCSSKIAPLQLDVYVRGGYVAISQDVRGTSRSEGVFRPLLQERDDGYDLVEWAATQPWSDGHVSMVGGSYPGATQWQAAIAKPPHLTAIEPAITGADYHDDFTFRNGVFDRLQGLSWAWMLMVPDQMARDLKSHGASEADVAAKLAAWTAETDAGLAGHWLAHLPMTDLPADFQKYAPFYDRWLRHPYYDDLWRGLDVGLHASDVAVPALIAGAWYDLFATGTIDSYRAMRDRGGTPATRDGTMLTMSWGGHAALGKPLPGQIDWGPDPSDKTLPKRFLDHYVRGVDNGIEKEPRVQVVVLMPPDQGSQGSSFLFKTTDFPIPGSRSERFFLASGGHANTSGGDGLLVRDSSRGPADRFAYDPNDPVPTRGGNVGGQLGHGGALDQSDIEKRKDVLVYKSAPLAEDMAVIGPVSLSFWARSSAKDTDFTAKLVDVHPDGKPYNVVDRIVRARLRRGSNQPPELIQPGRAYAYTLTLGSTATIFRKGHRVLLEISSSNFPHYARNLNTGLSNEETAKIEIAHQTILHDKAHGSYIDLPVAPIP